MKKITFLLFTLISIAGFSQTFDFNNSDDGWAASGFTATNNATFINLTTVDGDGTKKNPIFSTDAAGVDTSTIVYVGITLKNNSANGPSYLRVSYPKAGDETKRVYKNSDISTGDTEFKTYWFDLTNNNWTGTKNDIKLHFKDAGNSDYVFPNNPDNASIDIEKIQFTDAIATSKKETFDFSEDDNTQGFSAINGTISGPTGGILTFTPTPAKFAKLEQLLHHVDADANKQVHITLKNNSSANDQLRFVGGGTTSTLPMTTSDSAEKTYTFDMTAITGWTGNQSFTIGIGSTADGKAVDDGTVEISSVVINNVLSTKNYNTLEASIYPNPAKDIIHISAKNSTISNLEIFNVLGKKVLETKTINKPLNISHLKAGIYLLKLSNSENKITTQKLIIN